MIEKSKVTCVYLSVYRRDICDGWSIGSELWKDGSPYFVYSLYLPFSKFKNKTEVLRYLIPLILNDIDEKDELVLFYSTLSHFYQVRRMHKISDSFSKGRDIRFFKASKIPGSVDELEFDAAQRRESIAVRL